jgi:hypothetical protein
VYICYSMITSFQILSGSLIISLTLYSVNTEILKASWSNKKTFSWKVTRSIEKVKSKVIPVTCLGGPYDCETSRLPHFLDNRLTDGGEVVRFTCKPAALYTPGRSLEAGRALHPRKVPGTHFC